MTDDEVNELLSRATVGRLGACEGKQPYVIPICFLYYKGRLYFHCGPKGKKIEILKANPKVCFQVDEHRLVPSSSPCDFTFHYRSVLVFGEARFPTNSKKKIRILKMMVDKYDIGKIAKPLDEKMVDRVNILEIIIRKISGKKNE